MYDFRIVTGGTRNHLRVYVISVSEHPRINKEPGGPEPKNLCSSVNTSFRD